MFNTYCLRSSVFKEDIYIIDQTDKNVDNLKESLKMPNIEIIYFGDYNIHYIRLSLLKFKIKNTGYYKVDIKTIRKYFSLNKKIPLYSLCKQLDVKNFDNSFWNSKLEKQKVYISFTFDKNKIIKCLKNFGYKKGYNYICYLKENIYEDRYYLSQRESKLYYQKFKCKDYLSDGLDCFSNEQLILILQDKNIYINNYTREYILGHIYSTE